MYIVNRIAYYLILKPLSLLPLEILYLLHYPLYFIVYKIIGYRVSTVRSNLKNTTLDHQGQDLRRIEKRFYHYFSDLLIESIKQLSISAEELKKRFKVENPEIFSEVKDKQFGILCTGHYGNWEWGAMSMSLYIDGFEIWGIYQKIKDPFWHKKIVQNRSRTGMNLLAATDYSLTKIKTGNPKFLLLINDQSPSNPHKCYWTKFLGKETAVLYGTEHISKNTESCVLFGVAERGRRGYYSVRFHLVTMNGSEEPYGYITEKVTSLLEKAIVRKPETWLWSHKRWKLTRPQEDRMGSKSAGE